jgi:predicted Zn-dependent protease
MLDPIQDLSQRWKRNPDVASTIALCEALRGTAHATLVQQVGEVATQRHSSEVPVLYAVARMYLDARRLGEAQAVLVSAGKLAPRDGSIYRVLGEVLLRRGDADRAEKVLERAAQLGMSDPETTLWLERARVLKVVQAKAGSRAVAAEVAAAPAPPPAHLRRDEFDDESPTEVRAVADLNVDPRRYAKEAETVPFPTPIGDLRTALDQAIQQREIGLSTNAMLPPPAAPPPRATSSRAAPSVASQAPPPRDPAPPPRSARPAPDASAVSPEPKARPAFPAHAPTQAGVMPLAQPPAPSRRDGLHDAPPPRVAAESATPYRGEAPSGVPNARDVLDALAIAGIFEPESRQGGVFRWDRPVEKTRRRSSLVLAAAMVLLVGVGVGAFKYITDERQKAHVQAESILETAEVDLESSRASVLPDVETRMGHAFELDSRSQRAALDWLRERAMVGILKSGAEVAFEDAIARATEVKVPDFTIAFARVAAFLFQGDTAGAAGLMPKWDGPAANDPWYQLLTGATLERAGDPRAADRYAAAARLDPSLVIAQVLHAQSTAIDGDPAKAEDLARQFRAKLPDRPEGGALLALGWARDPARGEQPPVETADLLSRADALPLPLAAVPHALAAIAFVDKQAMADAKREIEKGLGLADGPGIASWLGSIALDTRDEALVQKAALTAIGFSAVYPPARVLAARVALLGGRFDQALKATEDLDANSPDVAVVRAATAYERVDVDALGRALDAVPVDSKRLPFMSALVLAPEVLVGRAQTSGSKILEMSADEAPWSDLIAMDLALDLGELEVAEKIASAWKGSEDKPLRGLRLSRLARYQNKVDLADTLSKTALDSGTVTPRTLEERVFVLVAKNRPQDVAPLLAKYPLVLGPSATWLGAYALASANKVAEAQGKTASLDPPPPQAPLPARVIAAVALASMKDRRRAADYVKTLLSTGVQDPDLVAAAVSLGFRRIDHARRRASYE